MMGGFFANDYTPAERRFGDGLALFMRLATVAAAFTLLLWSL